LLNHKTDATMISSKFRHLRTSPTTRGLRCLFSSFQIGSLLETLELVKEGKLQPSEAEIFIKNAAHAGKAPEEVLEAFANLDHSRTKRTGFPEAVFAAGKTPYQVATILDDFARNLNEQIRDLEIMSNSSQSAILATRVTQEQYEEIKKIQLEHGSIEFNPMARIITMKASGLDNLPENSGAAKLLKRVVIATAGTTDLPVAEEAAVVLEAANVDVDRIYDVGVAGLHRVINALPRLQDPDVGCVIVCAGMDGALPSVVGGLTRVPVIACPTSIGYGMSLGGISAMLTMLNSCSPGVGVVNIDNGFGAAALAYKCILP
jgi:NCAIR mutase (PurE)-related protein